MSKALLIIAGGMMILLTSACNNEPKPMVVTFQLAHTVDTIFQKQYRHGIDVEIDSICVTDRQKFYEQAVDSLLRMEIAKMDELLE